MLARVSITSTRSGIGAVGGLGEQRVKEAVAVLQCGLGLEQGVNIDFAVHPEQLGDT